MHPFILYGSDKDQAIPYMLLAAMHSLRLSVLHLTTQAVTLLPPGAPEVSCLLLDDRQARSVQMEHSVFIFKSHCDGLGDITLPKAHAAVLNPENEQTAALLKARHIPVVTCGLSHKDTVTFSSRTPTTALVSLQREIHTAAGVLVEPRELPVTLTTPRDDYPLLAAIAAMWLAGIAFPEQGLCV